MKIALDAMGTDNRPVPDIAGGVLAAREFGDSIFLVGDQARIQEELAKHQTAGLNIEVVHAAEEIEMDETPSLVMKTKPQSSMHVGMNLVKNKDADAFVTLGNTGAGHAIATLSTLRRIPGVKRPALTGIYPIFNRNTIFLDVGANTDSKAEWLRQFAVMGSIYAQKVLGHQNPRIGTLSNGEEEGKGSQAVREVNEMLHKLDLNYIGNVEPRAIMAGRADVIVMDGFAGNVFVKMFEASTVYLSRIIREEINNGFFSKMGGLLTRPAFRRVRTRIDTNEVGGTPLLGVNGVVIIGHGGSDTVTVKNAIRQARNAVAANVIDAISDGLKTIKE